MHSLSKLGLDLMKFRREPFPHRLTLHHKLPFPADATVMRETKKVERLRFPSSVDTLTVLVCIPPKSDKPRLPVSVHGTFREAL